MTCGGVRRGFLTDRVEKIAPRAASNRALTPRLAVRREKGVGLRKEKKERERGRERRGRTAASISVIAGEGPRGGTAVGILLIPSHPRKSADQSGVLLRSPPPSFCSVNSGQQDLQPLTRSAD